MANAVFDDPSYTSSEFDSLGNADWIKKMEATLDSLDTPLTVGEIQQFFQENASVFAQKAMNPPLSIREIQQFMVQHASALGAKGIATIREYLNRLGEA